MAPSVDGKTRSSRSKRCCRATSTTFPPRGYGPRHGKTSPPITRRLGPPRWPDSMRSEDPVTFSHVWRVLGVAWTTASVAATQASMSARAPHQPRMRSPRPRCLQPPWPLPARQWRTPHTLRWRAPNRRAESAAPPLRRTAGARTGRRPRRRQPPGLVTLAVRGRSGVLPLPDTRPPSRLSRIGAPCTCMLPKLLQAQCGEK